MRIKCSKLEKLMSHIHLMTSNIRFANTLDGLHQWTVRKELLAQIFKSFSLDLLGTQEGKKEQLKELASTLPHLKLIDGHRTWISERMYPCIFVNPQSVDVHSSGDIWLSKTPDVPGSVSFKSTFPRLCTWAQITLKSSGMKMMVVNTHLDHVLSSTRKKQIDVLIKEIKKINLNPLIVMGDFNESPDTDIKKNLMKKLNLKDPWTEKNYPEETSHHGFKGVLASGGDRIDWILIPKNFECQTIALQKTSFENNLYPSDHYPLLATVVPK